MEVQLKKKIVSENELTMQILKTKKLRVAAYTRVSTEHDDQRLSLDSQRKHYLSKINDNENWELVDIYTDNGISGTNSVNREGFRKMMRDVGRGKIDLILTKSVSRFARNTIDTLDYVRKLRNKGIGVYFEEENINTLDMNGELLLTILSSIAQQESMNLSAHVNLGLKMKMQKGEACGTAKCYGYDYDYKTNKFTINEEQAKVIRMMAKLYLEGNGTSKISKKLIEMKIPNCKGEVKWREEAVTRILKNVKIKGDLLLGKYYTPDPITHKRKENKGVKDMYYVKNHHEAILDEETFQKIQDEMARRNKLRNHKTDMTCLNRYSTSGKLKCGYCGNTLHRVLTNSVKSPKYYCSTNKVTVLGECPESRMIGEDVLQKCFMQAINRLRNKIKLDHRLSAKVTEKISFVRNIILNKEIDIEKYDGKLFEDTVLFMVLGGYDENQKLQQYMIRIILKNEDNEICNLNSDYKKEYMNKELYKLLDFYSNQTFHYFEKDKKGQLKQKYVSRLRVQVLIDLEDDDGTSSNKEN